MRDAIRKLGSALATALLCVLCGGALQACFASHGPKDSTETGNPPFVNSKRVSLRLSADTVHIAGDKGAVAPGGAAIEITDLTTGKVTKAMAAADGSFDVQVGGSQDDAFVVRVKSASKTGTPVYVVHGGVAAGSGKDGSLSCAQRQQLAGSQLTLAAANADKQCMIDSDCQAVLEETSCYAMCDFAVTSQAGQRAIAVTSAAINAGLCGDEGCPHLSVSCAQAPPPAACVAGSCEAASGMTMPAALSCNERDQMAYAQIRAAVAAADKSCAVDSDCVEVPSLSCYFFFCGSPVVSQASQAAVNAEAARIERDVCGSFVMDGCLLGQPPCPGGPLARPVCKGGQCALGPASTTGPAACPGCVSQTLAWGLDGGLAAYVDQSTLEPCVHYRRDRAPGSVPNTMRLFCEADLMACNSSASVGAIETALANADVRAALAGSNPVLYGHDARPVDGTVFRITIGTQIIDVGGPCNGQSGCTEIPAGIQGLVDELKAVDQQLLALPQCQAFSAEGALNH